MKKYEVPFTFVFSGTCFVNASDPQEAQEIVEENMGACNASISDSGCEDIVDYDVEYHAVTYVEPYVLENMEGV